MKFKKTWKVITRTGAFYGALLPLSACSWFATAEVVQTVAAEGAKPVRVATGFAFTEGPATDRDGNVYFTDQPNDRIHKWSVDGSVTVFMEGTGRSNGMYFDNAGNLLTCADDKGELWSISPEREVTVLLDNVDGQRLNGPNDLWIDTHGGIYFTDPYYQRDYWTHTEPELASRNVYYLSSEGELSIVDDDLVQPNGIIGNEAGDVLYVADIDAGKTYSYDIVGAGQLENRRKFVDMGSDGMTLDTEGNLYLTGDGVTVFSKHGEQIDHIAIDEPWTANITFGGEGRQTLFITASKSIYTLDTRTQGTR